MDLVKSAVVGMLMHACAALAFPPHTADATALPRVDSVAHTSQACLLPPAVAATALAAEPHSGTRP